MSHQQLSELYPLAPEQITEYREQGFLKLGNVFTGAALDALREAVEVALEAEKGLDLLGRPLPKQPAESDASKDGYGSIFVQRVNLWQRHPAVREFVLSPRLATLAADLMGEPVRVWHDQALFKEAKTGANTPWHQDAPYWPHADKSKQLSIWIALRDATKVNGCMSFIPGSQKLGPKEPVRLESNAQQLHDIAPETRGIKPVTVELPAGSATFHHGLTFHYAGPNRSDETREAFVVIYMPVATSYDGAGHCLTDPMELAPGSSFGDADFPVPRLLSAVRA